MARDARGRFIAGSGGSSKASVGLVGMTATTKVETRRVKAAVEQATIRSIPRAGAYIRGIARRSIRRRQTASRPGAPPHTRRGRIKSAIRYDIGPAKTSVAIGPARESAGRLWRTLEFGGPAIFSPLSDKIEVGGYGPIRPGRKAKRPIRIKIRTPGQAARARALIAAENARRAAAAKSTISPRPFMRPALIAARPVIPHHWRNTVRGR